MPLFKISRSGVWKAIDLFKISKGGVWKDVSFLRIWKTTGNPPMGAWHNVYVAPGPPPPPPPPPSPPPPPPPPPVSLNVSINPTQVSGAKVGRGVVYTSVATATVTGGTGPYTYTWSRVSYTGSIIPQILAVGTPAVPSKAQFSRDMEGVVPEQQSARFKCFVQDSLGNIGQGYVDAYFYTAQRDMGDWTGGGGGGAIP